MKPAIDATLTRQFILPLDEARDLRMQYKYQADILQTLHRLEKLVHDSYLDSEEEHRLLWGIAYIETQVEMQTLDMCANVLTRFN